MVKSDRKLKVVYLGFNAENSEFSELPENNNYFRTGIPYFHTPESNNYFEIFGTTFTKVSEFRSTEYFRNCFGRRKTGKTGKVERPKISAKRIALIVNQTSVINQADHFNQSILLILTRTTNLKWQHVHGTFFCFHTQIVFSMWNVFFYFIIL